MHLKIGWAERNITPDKKVSLLGQFAERISEYVEKPLTATALAMEKDGDHAVLVGCDLAQVSYNLVADIRKDLADNDVGLDPMKVVFHAIHTHTGPGYPGGSRSDGENGSMFRYLRGILNGFLAPGQKYVEQVDSSGREDVATEEEVYALLRECLTA